MDSQRHIVKFYETGFSEIPRNPKKIFQLNHIRLIVTL